VNEIVLYAVIALGSIALFFAIIIFFVEKKFKIIENPKIDEVQGILPGANCGGCGFAGCRNFAESIVKAGNMENLYCPVGGNEVAKKIASILGIIANEKAPQIAVVRCNGTYAHASLKIKYEGTSSCTFINNLFHGENGCAYGCIGGGDCVRVCTFDAMYMNSKTGLPVVIEDKCTACGTCVKACPRGIIELRNKGRDNKRIFVACNNKEKGVVAQKNCQVACIGCNKCVKVCTYNAITLKDYLAYIDFEKCELCRKCVTECPSESILEINFPVNKTEVIYSEKNEELK